MGNSTHWVIDQNQSASIRGHAEPNCDQPDAAVELCMDKHQLSIGILSNGDPSDVRTWSGVPYSITRELAARFERIVYIPVAPARQPWEYRLNGLSRRLFGRGHLPWATQSAAHRNGRQIETFLQANPVDVMVSITVDHQVAFAKSGVPLVHLSDTTFAGIEDYYPQFTDLWGWARRAGHAICQQTLSHAAASIYPSQWAVDSAIQDYGAAPQRLHVVPYGANLENPPSRDDVLLSDRRKRCQLLFIGVDWERKGGNQAYATMQALRQRNIDACLVVVGCQPPEGLDVSHLTVHPFLNKQEPSQLALYQRLWLESSFLCMPSRAETFGAVFAEAAAYGLPVISSRTGGIGDAVRHGETGILLSLDATGQQFADEVEQIWLTAGRYQQMVQASRNRYESTLNWSAWADAVTPILLQAVENRKLEAIR